MGNLLPPPAVRDWVAGNVSPSCTVEPLSRSNNSVWLVATDRDRLVVKHLTDTSSDALMERTVFGRHRHHPGFRGTVALEVQPDGSTIVVTPFVDGRSLDVVLLEEAYDGTQAARWVDQWIDVQGHLGEAVVSGFGWAQADGLARHGTWSGFLAHYLEEQRAKGPRMAALRYRLLKDALNGIGSELDRRVRRPSLVAGDVNNRNYLVSSQDRLLCINLPVLWHGDPVKPVGEVLIHWAGTPLANLVRERTDASSRVIHFYAAYHAYVILVFAERFSAVPLDAVSPWGRRVPLLDLFDHHLAAFERDRKEPV